MIEIISAIALLCQINSGRNYEGIFQVDQAQSFCQKWYLNCIKDYRLEECVEKRSIE